MKLWWVDMWWVEVLFSVSRFGIAFLCRNLIN